jgi:hypothetical protein
MPMTALLLLPEKVTSCSSPHQSYGHTERFLTGDIYIAPIDVQVCVESLEHQNIS